MHPARLACTTAALGLLALSVPASAQTADPAARGRLLFLQCRACHTLAAGEPHKVGPNLHGLFGAAAASRPGFAAYSKPLRESGILWDEAALDRFLAGPGRAVPGTTMAFAGLPKPEDRAAVIAYLRAATR
ncbi:c-type cytochrome [Thermaurantiacus tibetensis]|uniref:c-type cytochrome n=1 Tax=Thermaurantiacus tibetensis TaxID=2759035 RepID=UPI00188E9E1F|nr:cytochrome c family protein [Thermaurantiacus tibetensis]